MEINLPIRTPRQSGRNYVLENKHLFIQLWTKGNSWSEISSYINSRTGLRLSKQEVARYLSHLVTLDDRIAREVNRHEQRIQHKTNPILKT